MAEAEASVRKVGVAELRAIISDAGELAKGTELFDRGQIGTLSRYGDKLFGEAKGSGSSPYKMSISFAGGTGALKAKCSCPAAWSRPICKHAAALLVAWARAPEAFVVSEGPPPGAAGAKKSASVKTGKVDADALRKQGAEQVVTLVRELGAAGVASLGEDRLPQIQKLGENLRDYKLRRLSARTLDLTALLGAATARGGTVPALAYADLVADLLLTARKLEKHLGSGEPLDPRHVEELVGKTWQKTDLEPLAGLDLVEYTYSTKVTSDQFIIYESRFFDLATGTHYSEKQITPLAFGRGDPKVSRAGTVLAGLRGGRYPGYPPFRLKITDLGNPHPVDHESLARLVEKAIPDVGAALAALAEHRRDVFAPDLLPIVLRVDTLFARGARMQAVDAAGHALHLPDAPALADRLGSALGGAKLAALLGDVGIEAALPTLFPLAAVVEGPLGYELRLLAGGEGTAAAPEAGSAAWIRAAREAGASAAAIALAEVREELADAFVVGLAALGARVVEPLAARLSDLGMAKQAALLAAIAKAEPEARLDDFVKLYQVLGIALVRLAGATEVDRATLTRVPTYESVFVQKPEAWLPPDQVTAQRDAGKIGRYEAAVQYAHHYENLPPEELAESIYPTWADGSAAPYVVRAVAGRRDAAIAAAKKALGGKGGRVAKITALRVLAAAGGLEAERILHDVMTTERDIGMRALAADARDAIETRTLGPQAVQRRRAPTLEKVAEAAGVLTSAKRKEEKGERAGAITKLVQLGHLSAIPALRQAFHTDAARDVREEAALALALLGDTEMVETFVAMLRRRGEDDAAAKMAAHALGLLGDVRGLRALLDAYAEGYRPPMIGEALRSMGPMALEPLLDRIEANRALASRKAVLEALPDRDLAAALVTRVRASTGTPGFADTASLYLDLSKVHPDCRRAVAQAVLDAIPDPAAHKALVKKARSALG